MVCDGPSEKWFHWPIFLDRILAPGPNFLSFLMAVSFSEDLWDVFTHEDPGNTRTLGIRGPWEYEDQELYEDPGLYEDPRAIRGPRAATGRNVLSRWGSARTQSSSLGQMSQHLSAPNFSKFTNNLENMKSTIAPHLGLLLFFFIFLLLF